MVDTERPPARRWLKMGAELEGGWDTDLRAVSAKVRGSEVRHDGSVRVRANYPGELVTRPHEILDKLCEDIRALYPNHVDASCGFHLHASFTVLDHIALTDRLFWVYFRRRWKDWGEAHEVPPHYWDRWKGINPGDRQYCKAEFKPETQFVDHNDRYTQLNFTAWHKHKTLECRMLPMFPDVALTIEATRNLSDIFDTYLNEYKFPTVRVEDDIKTDPAGYVEEFLDRLPDRTYSEETETDFVRVRKPFPEEPGFHTGYGFDHVPGVIAQMLPHVKELPDDGEA